MHTVHLISKKRASKASRIHKEFIDRWNITESIYTNIVHEQKFEALVLYLDFLFLHFISQGRIVIFTHIRMDINKYCQMIRLKNAIFCVPACPREWRSPDGGCRANLLPAGYQQTDTGDAEDLQQTKARHIQYLPMLPQGQNPLQMCSWCT